jgi:cleavage stimulation factor subunit 3
MRRHPMVNFCYADYHERREDVDKALTVYNSFVANKDLDPTPAYIKLMEFCRRNEGIKPARVAFRKARENLKCRYHIFIAAALMEYLYSKDKNVAFKIFELGLKKYATVAEYVLAYVDYLSHLNGKLSQ